MSSSFSPSPVVSSSSPPALATPYFADAFEFLGARVHADLLAWSPHFNDDNTSPAPTSRRAIAARSAEIAKAREKAAHWVKLKVIRMLKSGFTTSLGKGKRTADVSEPSSDDTRRSKWRLKSPKLYFALPLVCTYCLIFLHCASVEKMGERKHSHINFLSLSFI